MTGREPERRRPSLGSTLFADGQDVAERLRSLRAGSRLTLVGCDAVTFVAWLTSDTPSLLRLELASVGSTDEAIGLILDDLADLALATWPDWPESPLAPWHRAADRLARAGYRPRFSRVPAAVQFSALHLAAGRPVLLFPLDPIRAERANPLIAALEWMLRHGAAVVALMAEPPPAEPPWDRVLHGAMMIETAPARSAVTRLIPTLQRSPGGSAVERRLRTALRADPALCDLFQDEATLRLGALGPMPRVDLLWQAGKIVVELDGIEHQRQATYAADRHRDYELLVAGYLVLRLTNAEVELDLARAMEKIRRVVALRSDPS